MFTASAFFSGLLESSAEHTGHFILVQMVNNYGIEQLYI